MDILNFHKKLIDNYKTYIQSFLNIKDPTILKFVDSEIDNKNCGQNRWFSSIRLLRGEDHLQTWSGKVIWMVN